MTTIPNVGLFRTERHLYYRDGVGPVPGITGVLRIIDKPGLSEWLKRETARCALDQYDIIQDLLKRGGRDAAIAWLSKIPDFVRDSAGDLGSAVHRMVEGISRDGEVSPTPEQEPYVEGYRNFLNDYQPQFKSLERMVWSEKGYGGTFDWIATIDGSLVLGDTKTGKAVYPETALQLAALRYADHIGVTGDPQRWAMPAIDRCAVLHLRPELYASGYRLIEVRAGPEEFTTFRAALKIHQWRKQPTPIGESVPLKEKE